MSSEDPLLSDSSQLRIVLVGKVGTGKTSVMNTFLRSCEENEKPDSCGTEPCQVQIAGQTVVLIDTPGLCSTKQTDEVMKEIKRRVSLAAPGPHVFLFVLSCLDKFSEDQDAVKMIKATFGEHVKDYTVVLFTSGDQLKKRGKPIEVFIGESNALKSFVDECKGGHYLFDNRDQNPSQVKELLQKISVMVQTNGGKCYSAGEAESEEKGESGEKGARLKKRFAATTSGSALAGAAVGGMVSHFVGGPFGFVLSAAAGGIVGATVGGAGIFVVEYAKHRCMIQ